jgi:hypothetical protein
MEFGSFMLVPLFFVHLLNPRFVIYYNISLRRPVMDECTHSLWRTYGMYVRPVYMFCTSGLTVFTIIWALLSAIEQVSAA